MHESEKIRQSDHQSPRNNHLPAFRPLAHTPTLLFDAILFPTPLKFQHRPSNHLEKKRILYHQKNMHPKRFVNII